MSFMSLKLLTCVCPVPHVNILAQFTKMNNKIICPLLMLKDSCEDLSENSVCVSYSLRVWTDLGSVRSRGRALSLS